MVHIHHVTEMFFKILCWGLARLKKNNKGISLCKHLQFSFQNQSCFHCSVPQLFTGHHKLGWTESGAHILSLHTPLLLISIQELQIYIRLRIITPSHGDMNRSLCSHSLWPPQHIGLHGWGQDHVIWRWWNLWRARNVEISVTFESSENSSEKASLLGLPRLIFSRKKCCHYFCSTGSLFSVKQHQNQAEQFFK